MDTTGSISTHSREQIVVHESGECVIHLPAVPSVEHCSGAGTVTNTQDISFLEDRVECRRSEWVVIGLVSVRVVGNREATVTRQPERRIRFCCQPDCDICCWGKVKHLNLPVIDFVKLG